MGGNSNANGIAAAAGGPRSASGDTGSAAAFGIEEQIRADQYRGIVAVGKPIGRRSPREVHPRPSDGPPRRAVQRHRMSLATIDRAEVVDALERMTASSPAPIVRANRTQVVTRAKRQLDVLARFDAQYTTPETAHHFALMDAMSIDAAASWMVRRVLRMKCRYEYHNNAFFMGLADTVANYVISAVHE